MIIADATEEFVGLAEYFQIPVVTTHMGKGGFPCTHPLYAGQVGIQCNTRLGNKTFLESDLVLGIGCRFNDRHTGTLDVYTKGRKFIHVDIDPMQIGKIVPPELGIVSDAKLALREMLRTARETMPAQEPGERAQKIPELREQLARESDFDEVPIKPQRVFKEINEFFDDETVFVTCIGLNQIWSGQFQRSPNRAIIWIAGAPAPWDGTCRRPSARNSPARTSRSCRSWGITASNSVPRNWPWPACTRFPILDPDRQQRLPLPDPPGREVYLQHELRSLDLVRGRQQDDRFREIRRCLRGAGRAGGRPPADQAGHRAGPQWMEQNQKPALIDILVERDTDASMGASIDAVREFEEERVKGKKEEGGTESGLKSAEGLAQSSIEEFLLISHRWVLYQ